MQAQVQAEDLKNRMNERLRFKPWRSFNEYQAVHVLIIYWDHSDHEGYAQEGHRLGHLLGNEFNYLVEYYKIPSEATSEESHLKLDKRITAYLECHNKPDTLVILHYGGHGEENEEEGQRLAVWASDRYGSLKVEWSHIQQRLGFYRDIEFLVLLDCCFGAQAAREVRKRMVPQNVELVAACAMGVKTREPGPESFTHKLIDEVSSLLKQSRKVCIQDVVNGLASRFNGTRQSPVRYSGLSRPICLERLPTGLEDQTNKERAFMTLRMAISDDVSDTLVDELICWLQKSAPRKVTRLTVEEVIVWAEKAQHYIFEGDRGASTTATFNKLSPVGKNEIMRAWHSLSAQLTTIGVQLKRSSAFANQPVHPAADARVEQAESISSLQDLENNVLSLHRSIERHVMALPDLYEAGNTLLAAVEDRVSRDMGFLPLLELRLKVRFSQNLNTLETPAHAVKTSPAPLNNFSTIFEGTMTGLGSVLLEYKSYKSTDTAVASMSTRVMNESARHLSAVLHTDMSTKFCNLRCEGWFHEINNQRFGLIFRRPAERNGIISLRDVILKADRLQRPTLEQRYTTARVIGDALLQWHTADWVHQGVASHNIIFFWENATIDYSKPYLCGFEYSRPTGTPSTPKRIVDFEKNVYRHPSRQGVPTKLHTKRHDIYSYGVLLLEIGIWDLAAHCFDEREQDDKTRTITPLTMQDILVDNAQTRLNHYMGTAYQEAACTCLKLDFDIEVDDDVDTQLGIAFEDTILKKIPLGDHVDNSHPT